MIFILDDDAGVRDSLRILLECEGLEAREFATGEEFLAAVRPGKEDWLIVDVHMPGMSGLDLLEELRRRGETVPAVVITGRPSSSIDRRAQAAGALAVIEKPYQANEILNLIQGPSGGGAPATHRVPRGQKKGSRRFRYGNPSL